MLPLAVLQNHSSLSKITTFFLIECFSIHSMEECNVKYHDLLMLFEKTTIHVFLGGSYWFCCAVDMCPTYPMSCGNSDISPLGLTLNRPGAESAHRLVLPSAVLKR